VISESTFRVVSTGLMIAVFVSWFVFAINLLRANANRKEGVPWSTAWGIALIPANLTQRGLVARRYCHYAAAGFILSAIALVVLSKFVS
jgi:hypothetical protein